MDINVYQKYAKQTAIYPNAHTGDNDAITYTILGAVGEAGELANAWKKAMRDGEPTLAKERVRYELGDVLWYVANLAAELGMTLEQVAQANLDKLMDRQARGRLGGSGDKR